VFNRENKDYNLLEAEAVRVVKSQPKWTPGMQKGEYVNVSFTIPIVFSISGKEYKKQ
jgi:hypothetical protein